MSTPKQIALDTISTLHNNGFQAFLVGGCVRDTLLGREPHDFDVCTNATPDEIEPLFSRTLTVGKAFGVVVVVSNGTEVEVATFRNDGEYSDGRRPDTVTYSTTATEDVYRRDFTINGLLLNTAGDVVDYVGGGADLKDRIIRTIGDPQARFSEDPLRMLRAARFASQLGFNVAPATLEAIRSNRHRISTVSRERVTVEFFKLLLGAHPLKGLEVLFNTGLAEAVFPDFLFDEIAVLERFAQFRPLDSTHALSMILLDGTGDLNLKLSVYESQGSAEAVDSVVELASVSSLSRAEVVWLLRRFPTREYGVRLLTQDSLLGGGKFKYVVDRLTSFTDKDITPNPLLKGDDLLALGFTPSPAFKRILNRVEAAQLNGEISTRDEAVALALSH